MLVAIDTETTGIDFKHGSKPFFISTCNEKGDVKYWEWFVDPLTRVPVIPDAQLREVDSFLLDLWNDKETLVVLQNSKFDVAALHTILPYVALFDPVRRYQQGAREPWAQVRDTLIAGHLLESNGPHNLTDMGVKYVGYNVEKFEKALEDATKEARSYARRKLKSWRIASDSLEEIPSATEKSWKIDTWLPRALVYHLWLNSAACKNCGLHWKRHGEDKPLPSHRVMWPGWEYHPPEIDPELSHPWWTVLSDYATADAEITVALWQVQWRKIVELKLDKIFAVSMEKMRLAFRMESKGVTFSGARLDQLETEYQEESDSAACKLVNIARGKGYELELPKGAVNDSIRRFAFDVLKLEKIPGKKSKTKNPSLDSSILAYYLSSLPERSIERCWVSNLAAKRKRDTALSFIQAYRRFAVPYYEESEVMGRMLRRNIEHWFTLYPSLNPTGTDTLRWSSQNPNEQNISKREGFNLRYAFGPAPGREWWSLDAENIELRLPAYEAKEKEMIALFERPKDPPYFGSNHLLVSHILHTDKFEACITCSECGKEMPKKCKCKSPKPFVDGRLFKERYDSTWYQWVKNGNFAVQYGAVEESGTADRAYHMEGAQRLIQSRFKNIKRLNDDMIKFATKHGYVETIPDRTVDPKRGYPLLCTRTQWGRILPTVPLNYHVQGTAMWWMMKAMIRCQNYLDSINTDTRVDKAFMVMQVHDELVFDFPAGEGDDPWKTNLDRILVIRDLMMEGGNDIGIPTPVSVKYHANNWSEGVKV